MAIQMPGVIAPRAEAAPQKKEKKSTLETIMEGVQLANGILGIGVNVQQIRAHQGTIEGNEMKNAALADERSGVLSATQKAEISKSMEPVAIGTPGSTTHRFRGKGGKVEELGLRIPEKAGAAARPELVTTVGPDGKPVQKYVAPEVGLTLPKYQEPQRPSAPEKDYTRQERNTLQSSYDRDPGIRKNRAVMESYEEAVNLAKNPSPASDHNLVVAYFKSIDPNSIVKETEAETAAGLGGLQNRAAAWMKQNTGEAGLTDSQRADLLAQMRTNAKTAADRQDKLDDQYVTLADRRGVSKEDLRLTNRPTFEDTRDGGKSGGLQVDNGKVDAKASQGLRGRQKSPKDGKFYIEVAPNQWQLDPNQAQGEAVADKRSPFIGTPQSILETRRR
jgi:hypothetical protein